MSQVSNFGIVILFVLGLSGCSPRVYLVDRHTVLEEEAAGEWPDFEKDLLERSAELGPVPYPKTAPGEEQRRLYHVLNGELSFKRASGAGPKESGEK